MILMVMFHSYDSLLESKYVHSISGSGQAWDPCSKGACLCCHPGLFPGQLHGGYAFAKQDAYKLAKVGLSFNPDSVDEAAASLMGNKIPSAVPLRGTRMFIGADKVLQMVAQSCTAFQPKNSFLVRRVDSQTFGVGVEHSVLKLVFVPL